MKLRGFGLRAKLIAGGLAPVVLFVGLALLAVYSMGTLLKAVHEVDDTHKVIRQAIEVQERAYETQTGMRGFLLTGEDAFLNEFVQGRQKVEAKLASLNKALTNQEQALVLGDAERVLTTWQQEVADPAVALRREIGAAKDMNEMSDLVRQGMTKQYYEKFRTKLDEFVQREKSALVERQKQQARERDPIRLRDIISAVDYGNMVITDALQLALLVDEFHRAQLWFVISGSNEFMARYREARKKAATMVEHLNESVADNPQQVRLLAESTTILKEWIDSVLEPEMQVRAEIAKSKTMVDMKAYVSKGEDKIRFDKFKSLMETFRAKEDSLLAERQNEANATASVTRRVLVVGTVVVALVGLGVSYLFSGRITRPLVAGMDLAEAIGRGDLSRTLEVTTEDEVGRLSAALNKMVENLRDQTQRILEAVNVLAASATEISTTVSEVAASTSQTSAAVTQTSTTVDQLKQASRLAHEKAKNVAESSRQAAQISESGRKATEATIEKMVLIKAQMESIGETVVRLSQHSQAIADIIGTVQDLADQSNLLAVNASIEAARAGDQGKGFSVVAHEIKALAEQSKEATDRVRAILSDTQRWVAAVVMATEQGALAVDKGVEQSAAADRSIESLAEGVASSAQVAVVIQATTEQQFTGVDQVANAMRSIEQAVRQNSQGTAQLEAAVQRLSSLGEQLKGFVEMYKV
jgi:methyl-accepting chemotaxis protein